MLFIASVTVDVDPLFIEAYGFTNNTNIVVSSEGYIPTMINPTMESNIGLQNSYINFYNSKGSYGQISSSIGFNPETMKFIVLSIS